MFDRYDLPMYLILAFVVGVIGYGAYGKLQEKLTARKCVINGYSNSAWYPREGGVCMKVENGFTVTVNVNTL